ncbi:signal peptidase I [Bowmanella yangjiangensis]|uniref:Signal peptidase I n=1 Tax=Bowmanella yangjiangensis TaxID=2811230 RepID=A0ABS3CVX7_9ALTE|nr:signal peptidase I [Bowmanella yangjiangensis]MBN7821273.1 signal peptidase I [Bowmanella yangjiangensis]
MKLKLKTLLKENKGLLIFIALMLVFRSAVADWNDVPTGSMKPTILEGDRILVNKMAYDIRLPFSQISLKKLADPARGDIIVFESQKAGNQLVKRVVGVPGDVVEMRDNRLFINGEALTYVTQRADTNGQDLVENLVGIEHSVRIKPGHQPLANFPPVQVPENAYLALGDNRDNSADSRVIGFVPRHEIRGRAHHVLFSLNYDNFYLPRGDRFYHPI